jgi:predicted unusual protein kinase regulating ubiquinone biosynthesis (AarF/ABC1/UbiB family)
MQRLKSAPSSPDPEVAESPTPNGFAVPKIKAFGVELGPMESDSVPETLETPTPTAQQHNARADAAYKINRRRYFKIIFFAVRMFGAVIFWEVVLRRLFGSAFVARGRSGRTRYVSRRFKALAIDMGGVMIKLGQFISSRVDILPPEITDELTGLQDKVGVAPFDYIKTTVERELGPLDHRYAWFNPEPIAAASFGQVHRAQLHTGERVVVKVQRPNINDIVHTDLEALKVVARLSMYWSLIRRRANMPELLAEFSRVLWEELDYVAEADHILTFTSMFKNDLGIYVPGVYLQHSTGLILTMEDVTSIKLNDYAALEKAGINRKTVAQRLLDCYLRQIFDHKFFHADPHPGNLFIYPIPEHQRKPGAMLETPGETPFYLIFIDFGMVGRLTDRVLDGLRETIVSVATQNAAGLVASYGKLGVLLPGADTQRIEEATRVVFDKVWGMDMNQLQNVSYDEMMEVGMQFSDLLLTMPFQMPQDFIYLSRAVGILSGMCTGLDPRFDPWRAVQPFADKMLASSTDRTKAAMGSAGALNNAALATFVSTFVNGARENATRLARFPKLADTVLTRAERGELSVQVRVDDETAESLTRIERTTGQLVIGFVFGTVSLCSTLLYINGQQGAGTLGFGLAGFTLLMLLSRGRG